MFLFLGVLLSWSLLSFGAVLPYASQSLTLVWFVGAIAWLTFRIARSGRADIFDLVVLIGGLSLIFLGKPGIYIMAAIWGWKATRSNEHGVLKFFHFLLVIGVFEALLGLFQHFAAPGWIFGYQNTSGNTVSGTLINRNHFAGLLEMLVPVSIGMGFIVAQRDRDVARPYLYILSGAVIALALIFSVSRMGIFCFLATMVFVLVLMQVRSTHRRLAVTLGLGLLGLAMAGAMWIGLDTVIERYDLLFDQDQISEGGRLPVFRDTIEMIRTFPGGIGIGRYQDVFRRFQTSQPELLFDHAHNDYLETVAEWGIVLAGVFWIFIGVVFVRSVTGFLSGGHAELQGIRLACIGALFSILLHSFGDFNLQIPSNALLFFTFVGISLGVQGKFGREFLSSESGD